MNTNLKEFFIGLDSRTDCESFGEMEFNTIALDGFGLNPIEILSGKSHSSDKGTRVCLEYFGGISGKLSGAFNGTDYLNAESSGGSTSNVHGVITTEGGQKLAFKLLGKTSSEGEVVCQITLRHNGEELNWVNSKHFLATGKTTLPSGTTRLTLYAFDNFPSEMEGAFPDPDESSVDYANFPFELEQLQADDAATIIYAGQGHLNTVESFGADVQAVFSGNVAIPEDGLRLNGFFSGPVAGSVNGVISGRNFLRVMPDGSMRMNSKIIARTLEGETLLLEALGASFPKTGIAWFETSRAVSNLDRYAKLTKLINVGVGSTDVASGQIEYNHYGYENDPFA